MKTQTRQETKDENKQNTTNQLTRPVATINVSIYLVTLPGGLKCIKLQVPVNDGTSTVKLYQVAKLPLLYIRQEEFKSMTIVIKEVEKLLNSKDLGSKVMSGPTVRTC